MEFLLSIIQIPLLIYFIRYLQKQHSDVLHQNLYYYLLSFKVTCGLCLGIIYYRYYGIGDTLAYARHLDNLSKIFYTDFMSYINIIFFNDLPTTDLGERLSISTDPRAFFFVKLVSPFYILSGSNYWIIAIYLSVFAFSGMWILSDTLIKITRLNSLAVLISFFLVPSIVFWSSGVLKESIAIGVIGYCISFFLNLIHKRTSLSYLKFIICVFFLWILLQIKFYYFACLMGVLVPYCIMKLFLYNIQIVSTKKSIRIGIYVGLVLFSGLLVSLIHPLLSMEHIVQTLYLNYINTLEASGGLNVFYFNGSTPDLSSFMLYIPKALVYGLFGPFLWHCKKIIALPIGVESTVILVLFIVFVLTNMKKEKFKKIDIEEISIFLYVSILAIFMAFASPNWGTLVRYKVAYLPFFLVLILNNNPFIHQLETKLNFLNRSDKKE